jgi:hypothetical protein
MLKMIFPAKADLGGEDTYGSVSLFRKITRMLAFGQIMGYSTIIKSVASHLP